MDIKTQLRDYYDRYCKQRSERPLQVWKIEIRDRFLAALKAAEMETMIELGSGPGQDSRYFQQKGFNITAIDLSPNHIEYCRKLGINAVVMDFYAIDFPDASFDALYTMNSLLHVPKEDLPTVLCEIQRIVKDRGLIFIGVYGGKSEEGLLDNDHCPGIRFFSFYTYHDYKKILEKKFSIVDSGVIEQENDFEFHWFVMKKDAIDPNV